MSDDNTLVGEVIFFSVSLGYGFIKQENNTNDLFCHYSDISCEGFKTLYKGQKVSYKIGLNHHGQDKAIEVTVLKQ